jgi:hypothetical protein
MAKQTKDQKIAALEAQVKHAEGIALDVMRDRDDARSVLAAVTIGAKGDDIQRLRLAALAFPQDDPSTVSWDELARCYTNRERDKSDELALARKIGDEYGINSSKDLDMPELLEGMAEKLAEAREEHEKLEALPEGWEEWAAFVKDNPDLEPNDVAQAMRVLEILGLNSFQRMCVLTSDDMAYTLKQELARQ